MSTRSFRRNSLFWFAHHELRLSWRDTLGMMTGGKPGREKKVAIGLLVFLAILHFVAWCALGRRRRGGSQRSAEQYDELVGHKMKWWRIAVGIRSARKWGCSSIGRRDRRTRDFARMNDEELEKFISERRHIVMDLLLIPTEGRLN